MRILHFYKSYLSSSMGGVEQLINQIARGTAKQGAESEVLSLTSAHMPRTIELDGHLSHHARMDFQIASTGFSISAFPRFRELAQRADVIHYHFPWPFMDMVHFAARVHKPTVVTYHSDIIRQRILLKLYEPLQQRFLASIGHIVATSPNYFATSALLRRFAAKVSVIPIGLDKDSYPRPDPERLQYWHRQIGDRFFLFVGVLRYYKGLHILMEAVRDTDFPVVIVGTGPIERELKAQAERLQLNNVRFLGQLPDEDKVSLLTLCYGVVFPSHLRSEAFGISLLEGAMFGKPMISSEIGTGTTFINIGGETGLVIPPSDPAALHKAMRYLWDHPAEAAEMGKRAERRYWDNFTADKMARDYMELYRDLVQRRKQ